MRMTVTILALSAGLMAASCASSEPEQLKAIGARALAGCPGAIDRSHTAGDYDYSLEDCECVAGRITTPLWSDENSSYTGDPMPIADARAIARAINKGETFEIGLEQARETISVPSSNSVNTCFAK